MSTATLRKELDLRVDRLSDDSLRMLIGFIDSLKPAVELGGTPDASDGGRAVKRRTNSLAGGLVYMADDFDETPECFKEYM